MAESEKTPRKPFLLGLAISAGSSPAKPFAGVSPKEAGDDAGPEKGQSVTDLLAHIEPFELVPHRTGAFEFPKILKRLGR